MKREGGAHSPPKSCAVYKCRLEKKNSSALRWGIHNQIMQGQETLERFTRELRALVFVGNDSDLWSGFRYFSTAMED